MVMRLIRTMGERLFAGEPASAERESGGRRRLILRRPDTVIYAVGDVHGCHAELLEAEQKILADAPQDRPVVVVMLGDYVDRGPHSAQVLDHLRTPLRPGIRRICLAGNHDDEMLRFALDPESNREWLEFGGLATLRSYGYDPGGSMTSDVRQVAETLIPPEHVAFLAGLPILLAVPGFIFVHAGILPGVQIPRQADRDMMWIREPFLSLGPCLDVVVVHGHTPGQEPSFGPNRIGIDTAAYAGGHLTVAKIEDGEIGFI